MGVYIDASFEMVQLNIISRNHDGISRNIMAFDIAYRYCMKYLSTYL